MNYINTAQGFSGNKLNLTCFDYFGARYYDSDISVWLSVEPLASKYPSMSPYMYTAGNPVMLVDPDGREIIKSKRKYKTMKDGSERELNWLSFRKADRIEINITVKDMKIIDLTGHISAEDMAKEAKGIQDVCKSRCSTPSVGLRGLELSLIQIN